MKYTIYQLQEESNLIFMNFDYATKHGGSVIARAMAEQWG